MDRKTAVYRALMEQQVLQQIEQALRVAIDLDIAKVGFAWKVSSVRFAAESFQRHFERLMSFEEDGGYMRVITEEKPTFVDSVQSLRCDHDRFREGLDQSIQGIARVDVDKMEDFNELCETLCDLLAEIHTHEKSENHLLYEVFLRDEGGEG